VSIPSVELTSAVSTAVRLEDDSDPRKSTRRGEAMRRRFWVEAGLAALATARLVLTMIYRE